MGLVERLTQKEATVKKYLYFSSILLLMMSCSKETNGDTSTTPERVTYYAAVDDLIVRAEPDPNLPAIAKLDELEAVKFLGEETEEEFTFTLRGQELTYPFLKVELFDGTTGWVFAGGVSTEQIALEETRSVGDYPDNDPPEMNDTDFLLLWLGLQNSFYYFGSYSGKGFNDGEYWTIVEQDGYDCIVSRSEILFETQMSNEFSSQLYPYGIRHIQLGDKTALFLFYGAEVPEGEFKALTHAKDISDEVYQTWTYLEKEYAFEVILEPVDDWYIEVEIFWAVDGQSQRIYRSEGSCEYNGYSFEVYWVGDIDQDGYLDLVGNFSIEDEGGLHFYLSSHADEGEFLGLAYFTQDSLWR